MTRYTNSSLQYRQRKLAMVNLRMSIKNRTKKLRIARVSRIVDKEILDNSNTLALPIITNNLSSLEINIATIVYSTCLAFNCNARIEVGDENYYDFDDYILRIILPSQALKRYNCVITSLYLERFHGKWQISLVTGIKYYSLIDDYCNKSSKFIFSFDERIEAINKLRQILYSYYLPFSTVEKRLRYLIK
jgi:hypothetical protein